MNPTSRFFGLIALITDLALGGSAFATSSDNLRVVLIVAIVLILLVAMWFVYRLEWAGGPNVLAIPVVRQTGVGAESIRLDYDVYVATAVAAIADENERKKRMGEVQTLVDAVGGVHGGTTTLRVFNACAKIKTRAAFDDAAMAVANNIKRMRASRHLALFYFENLPTSALIEVGMALSLGKDSVWFLKEDIAVPYLMSAQPMQGDDLPRVRVVRFADLAELKAKIQKHGAEYFPP